MRLGVFIVLLTVTFAASCISLASGAETKLTNTVSTSDTKTANGGGKLRYLKGSPDVKDEDADSAADEERTIGANFLQKLKSVARFRSANKLPGAVEKVPQISNEQAKRLRRSW
ncbi:unnamed protein product [Phytophthora lilii]|uniref:RxLR effector protein n=1 Tax=Phytophthora lilii TaxID=2077276 RepID=A0A9W6TZ21_9STRA|nr:unnamed protein product [Phytophthora lilii]